jgi:insulysin
MVEKEVNAVNNEYEIATNSDDWKYDVLMKKLSDCNHPFSKFSIGNHETLLKSESNSKYKVSF